MAWRSRVAGLRLAAGALKERVESEVVKGKEAATAVQRRLVDGFNELTTEEGYSTVLLHLITAANL